MLLSLNWLKDFVKLPKAATPEELAKRLSLHTVEVEGVENQAKKYDKVVVGKILSVEKHPNANRLRLAKVTTGKETLEIVCGAPNIEAGQLVPVALPGAVLPNGAEIKEAEVRGVKSAGMLCAPDELGLGEDHSGILILKDSAKAGESLAGYLKLDETVIEIDNKSLTNRPDLWGHLGMAREIAAIFEAKFSPYQPNKKLLSKPTGSFKIKVTVEDDRLCPRYTAIGIEGIKIEASAGWLQKRLIVAGMRPINNVVDVTNYVMLELGQPLHAFDQRLIDEIIIRRAKTGETIETLDGEKRKLDSQILVIADSKKPVAIAGIMGGANSEIAQDTSAIIIESANFDFVSVRKTSQKLNLRTESSARFEKALDPFLAETAINRVAELILKICPAARVATELVDIFSKEKKAAEHTISLNLDWLNQRIGLSIGPDRVIKILESLGFGVKRKDAELTVIVPSWRATKDITIPEDLFEEVARIFGYNNLTLIKPQVLMNPPAKNKARLLEREIKELLAAGTALTEVYNYSFVGEEQLKKLFIDSNSHIRLANPIAAHQTMLRQSLVPGLVDNIKTNQSRYKEIGLFEIGSVFMSSEGELDKDKRGSGKLPFQEQRLCIALADDSKADLFRMTKGIVEYILNHKGLAAEWRENKMAPAWADTSLSSEIIVAGKQLGTLNKLNNKIGKSIGLKKEAVFAELSMGQLSVAVQQNILLAFREFEKFPPATRDLAIVVNQKILYSDIKKEIFAFSDLVKKAELFDVYQGGKLGEKNKNLAFHIVYQTDRTLTSQEVDELQKGLIKKLEEKFGAKVRDF